MCFFLGTHLRAPTRCILKTEGPFSLRWGLYFSSVNRKHMLNKYLLRWFSMSCATSSDYFGHLKAGVKTQKWANMNMCGVCFFCDFHVWCYNAVGEVAAGCAVRLLTGKRKNTSRGWYLLCQSQFNESWNVYYVNVFFQRNQSGKYMNWNDICTSPPKSSFIKIFKNNRNTKKKDLSPSLFLLLFVIGQKKHQPSTKIMRIYMYIYIYDLNIHSVHIEWDQNIIERLSIPIPHVGHICMQLQYIKAHMIQYP